MADTADFDAVRTRREALYQAIVGLEDALATPIGNGPKWRLRVAMAIDYATMRIDQHCSESEEPGGFLDQTGREAPRLSRRINQLRVDHERLEKEVFALQVAIGDLQDADVDAQASGIRNQALEFLGHLARHRQRGSDLVYEAYQVDLGTSA